jgi:hypothetical protein
MSNLTIFKNPNAVAAAALPPSQLGEQIASKMGGYNRIATNTNGTFKRIVNGEQMGKAIRGEFNAIIVDMLGNPGRSYYIKEYDPDAKPTAPDCYSNEGDKPEPGVAKPQHANCANCPKNAEGSGKNGKGKACRFQRKVALLLEGDTSGDVYQFNIPAKSLFGKGSGNTHPFESYCRYLVSNGAAPDRVVTTIAYNLDAETMELNFTADRFITPEELELVTTAQNNPTTRRLITISSGEADGAKKAQAKAETVVQEEAAAPKKKKPSFLDDDEDEEEAPAPTKRASAAKEAAPLNSDLASVVGQWADDDEDDD